MRALNVRLFACRSGIETWDSSVLYWLLVVLFHRSDLFLFMMLQNGHHVFWRVSIPSNVPSSTLTRATIRLPRSTVLIAWLIFAKIPAAHADYFPVEIACGLDSVMNVPLQTALVAEKQLS